MSYGLLCFFSFLTFLRVSVLSVSGVNLESADAQEIGITYEMRQVRNCSWKLAWQALEGEKVEKGRGKRMRSYHPPPPTPPARCPRAQVRA